MMTLRRASGTLKYGFLASVVVLFVALSGFSSAISDDELEDQAEIWDMEMDMVMRSVGELPEQRIVLCSIKNNNKPIPWIYYNVDPCDEHTDLCIIPGVSCDAVGNVTALKFRSFGLAGNLTASAAGLNLTIVDISDNYLLSAPNFSAKVSYNCTGNCINSTGCSQREDCDLITKCLKTKQCYTKKGCVSGKKLCQECRAEETLVKLYPLSSNTSCDDDIWCTVNDTCDGLGNCIGDARPCAEPKLVYVTAARTDGTEKTNIYGYRLAETNKTPPQVRINQRDCENVTAVSLGTSGGSLVSCFPPEGTGTNLPVELITPDHYTVNSSLFSYHGPVIKSIEEGDTDGIAPVTIQGQNFGADPADVIVSIGGSRCNISQVNHTQLSFFAPSGTGKKHFLNLTVNKQNTNASFSYKSPLIYSATIGTSNSSCTFASEIIIDGNYFGTNTGVLNISIGGKNCASIKILSPETRLSCFLSGGAGQNVSVNVTVDNAPGIYPVFSYPAPEITGVSSAETDGRELLHILGKNFGDTNSEAIIKIGDLYCNDVHVNNGCNITCYPPPGCGKNWPLSLQIENTVTSTNFSYSAPSLSQATTTSVTGIPGTTIFGRGFGPSNTLVNVTIDGKQCTNATVVSDSMITCTPPQGVSTNLTINVTVPNSKVYGQTCSATIFSYQGPTISDATITLENTKTVLYINGNNFGFESSQVDIKTNGKTCDNITLFNYTYVSCYPQNVSGAEDTVVVTVPPNSPNFAIASFSNFAPVIEPIGIASTYGNKSVQLIGTNFGDGSECRNVSYRIDGGESRIATYKNAQLIEVNIPPGTGKHHQLLVIVQGLAASSIYFDYIAPLVLVSTNSSTAGSQIIITGKNFGNSTDIYVDIGGEACSNITIMDPPSQYQCQISCLAPPGTGILQSLKVCAPTGEHSQCSTPINFFYQAPIIDHTDQPPTMGGEICITGSNFGNDSTVLKLSVNEENVTPTCSNETHVCFIMPEGTGHVAFSLTVDGQIAISSFNYTAPTILNVSTISTGGGYINLTGLNFGRYDNKLQVTIAENGACSEATIISPHTEIRCFAQKGNQSHEPITVCVDSICGWNYFSYADTAGPNCDLVLTDEPTSLHNGAIVRMTCNEPVWNFSSLSFTCRKCKIDPFGTVPNVEYSLREHEFYLNVTRTGSGSKVSIHLKRFGLQDYAGNTNQNSTALTIKYGLSGATLGIIIGCAFVVIGASAAAIFVVARKMRRMMPEEQEIMKAIPLNSLIEDPKEDATTELFDTNNSTFVPIEDFPLHVQPHTLTFGFSTHQAEVDTEIRDQITLQNHGKKPFSFKLVAPPSYKYRLRFEPESGVLKSEHEICVEVMMVIPLTTLIDTNVYLAIAPGSNFDSEEVQHTLLPMKVESKLSTKLDPNDIILHSQLGSFGIVYKGEWQGQSVAVKVLKNQHSLQAGDPKMKDFEKEVKVMEALHCPQIVTFIGAVHVRNKLSLVTEFIEYGSLSAVLKKHSLDLAMKLRIACDTARGMSFLHKNGIIHRDLKLDNVLIASLDSKSSACAKISDFGTTREITKLGNSEALQLTSAVGTPAYMSPEVLQNGAYGKPTDVYSYGVLMHGLYSGIEPYTEKEEFNSYWKICEFVVGGKRLPLDEEFPEAISALITRCWHQDPKNRPDFETIVGELVAIKKSTESP
ncbi:tyrosine protein kinase [Pelomyxa schiedti]|nr:tyrosine protein kinase [Pelomyxa schiedti]